MSCEQKYFQEPLSKLDPYRKQGYPSMGEVVSGNILIRPVYLSPCGICDSHSHPFDHTTLIVKGSILIKAKAKDGKLLNEVFNAGEHVLIPAECEHEMKNVGEQDALAWCVYSHRTPQGEVVQEYSGWDEAYY